MDNKGRFETAANTDLSETNYGTLDVNETNSVFRVTAGSPWERMTPIPRPICSLPEFYHSLSSIDR